jgi:hypothetical protein
MDKAFILKSSSTVPLTPELADEFATMTPSVTERPIDQGRIAYLSNVLASEVVVPFDWAFATIKAEEKKTKYRVNGQHSSTVLSQANGQFPKGMFVHLDEYEVPTKAALATLFRQFDPKKSARTALEVVNSYGSVVEALDGVSRKTLKLAAEAITWHARWVEENKSAPSGDDRYEHVLEADYLEFFIWLDGQILSIKTPELKNVAAIAAAWATYQVDTTLATEFWVDVAAGSEVAANPDEPAPILDDWLCNVREGKAKAKAAEVYQASISAWNAHVEEKDTVKLVTNTSKGLLLPKHPA